MNVLEFPSCLFSFALLLVITSFLLVWLMFLSCSDRQIICSDHDFVFAVVCKEKLYFCGHCFTFSVYFSTGAAFWIFLFNKYFLVQVYVYKDVIALLFRDLFFH